MKFLDWLIDKDLVGLSLCGIAMIVTLSIVTIACLSSDKISLPYFFDHETIAMIVLAAIGGVLYGGS